MDCTNQKKAAKSAPKSKRKKINLRSDDVASSSSNCENSKKSNLPEIDDLAIRTEKPKKQVVARTQKKKTVVPDVKKNNRKRNSIRKDITEESTSIQSSTAKTPKRQSNDSGIGTLPSSSSKTPSTSTPRIKLSCSQPGAKTPCSFYKVTEDENGKPVFSKSLIKYFLTVDSPEMDDLKNKRWNTSFLHETPKPNREIRFFTEEEDKDPKYFENVPDIESNLPDVPGSLHADIFKSIPVYDSDEDLMKVFKEITPVKMPNGRKKRKSRRVSCYNGKPLPDELLTFDYDDLLDSEKNFDDSCSDSKENIGDIKIEKP